VTAFLLLSKDPDITLAVGLGSFLNVDDSLWDLLMATSLIYVPPPAAIYYTFKRYMVGGLTEGAAEAEALAAVRPPKSTTRATR
jgi:multiple sugar transport system permease protein